MTTPTRTIRNEPDATTLNIFLEIGEQVAEMPDVVFENLPAELEEYFTREALVNTAVQAIAMLRSFDHAARAARTTTTTASAA